MRAVSIVTTIPERNSSQEIIHSFALKASYASQSPQRARRKPHATTRVACSPVAPPFLTVDAPVHQWPTPHSRPERMAPTFGNHCILSTQSNLTPPVARLHPRRLCPPRGGACACIENQRLHPGFHPYASRGDHHMLRRCQRLSARRRQSATATVRASAGEDGESPAGRGGLMHDFA